LGEKLSTAKSRLNKLIIFHLAQKCGMDICYRCGNKIDTVEEISIDHKESWKLSDDPVKYFYDMGNIAFSHLQCNSEAGIMSNTLLVKEESFPIFYG
jgi:hypothetical protein